MEEINLLSEEELLKDTERKLETYFKRETILKLIDKKIEQLELRISEIKRDLKEVNINIPEESKSISYEERVKTSSDGTSYAESSVMKITERMQMLLEKNELELIDLKAKRFDIKSDNDTIGEKIEGLKKEYKNIIEFIYRDGNTEEFVAQKLNIDRSNVNRRKITILRNIEHWFYWFNKK